MRKKFCKARTLQKLDWYFFRHILFYGFSVGSTALVSFIPVLVFVRILSAHDYSKIVLVKNTLLVVVALADLGLSQAVIRWINVAPKQKVFSNSACAISIVSPFASLVILAVFLCLSERIGVSINYFVIVTLFLLILIQLLNFEVINWNRAEHKSDKYALQCFARGLFQLVFLISFVTFMKTSFSYLLGLLVGEALFFVVILIPFLKKHKISFVEIDFQLVKQMLAYGWPFSLVAGSLVLLNSIDRYMLSFLTSNQANVAYYDSAYILATALIYLLSRAFNLYIFPVYMQNFKENNKDECISIINRNIRYYLFFGFLIVSMMVVLRTPMMHLLFPMRYDVASIIIAPVSLGVLCFGLLNSLAAGLYIYKKTLIVGLLMLFSLIINVGANFYLIPRFGISGAAYSTLIAFLFLIFSAYFYSCRYLKLKFPLISLTLIFSVVLILNYYF